MLAGLMLIGVGINMLSVSPWLVLGLFLFLAGIAPFVCKCEGGCCTVEKKKK